ncbi:uncharacterized protein LOC121855494 [Homarus americanus]|uniref:uncharacterized protein LOC121855494 n=1 Tax=Homarus americanus TaxID=6706 RepID=UPI001C45D2E6|nr:uncharacterized protein LOC121855494 [Homarus americanus]
MKASLHGPHRTAPKGCLVLYCSVKSYLRNIKCVGGGTGVTVLSCWQGVRVVAVEWTLHVLVTGSSDGRLRVWNPYVPEAALTALPPAPGQPPTDLLLCPRRRVIISCDADAVVRVYGVEGGRCLQTIRLSFPGGSGGLAPRPLTLLSSGHLLVACRDYLATITPVQRPHSPPHYNSSHMSRRYVSWEGEVMRVTASAMRTTPPPTTMMRKISCLRMLRLCHQMKGRNVHPCVTLASRSCFLLPQVE